MATVILVGTNSNGTGSMQSDYVTYSKFTAVATGTVTEFKVYSLANGNCKVAIYDDNAGEPGDKITGNDSSQAVTLNQWNTLVIADTPVVENTVYWLGVINSVEGADSWLYNVGGVRRYKVATYSTFTWPSSAGTGFSSTADYDEALAGWGTTVITLELRSSTSSRADTALNTSITTALRSSTSTRAAIILDSLVSIHIRSPTDTDARIVLDTAIVIALTSSTNTRAAIAISVAGPITLAGKSSTSTRAALSLDTVVSLVSRVGKPCQYYNDEADLYDTDEFYDIHWRVQTFTPSITHRILGINLPLSNAAGNPGMVTVGIRAVDGEGKPTGNDLCSGTTNGDTLPACPEWEWRYISIGGSYTLNAGTKYAIVVRLGGDAANKLGWGFDSPSPAYSGGAVVWSSNSGTTWTVYESMDYLFEEWGACPNTRTAIALDSQISLELKSATDTRTDISLTAIIGCELQSSTDTRAALILDSTITLALKSSTATRANITISVTAITELAGKSSTDTRADLTLDVSVGLELTSESDTRASLVLITSSVVSLYSTSQTRAALTLSALTLLNLKTTTTTRAALALTVTYAITIACRSSSATRAGIALDTVIVLVLESQTATRAALLLEAIVRHQAITMAMTGRTFTAAMPARELTAVMPSRTFGLEVRQNE